MGETSFFERIDVVAQTLRATLNNGPSYGRRKRSVSKIPRRAPSRVWRAKIRVRGHRRQMLSGLALDIERIPKNPENSQNFFQEYITDSDGVITISNLNELEMTQTGVRVIVNNDILRLKRIVFRKDGERSVLLVSELHFTEEEMRYYSLL